MERVSLLLPTFAQNRRLQIPARKVSATFVVQILKRFQAPLSLPLACLLIPRSGVILAASRKVKVGYGYVFALQKLCKVLQQNASLYSIQN